MSERAPYSRVYWSVMDDPKFDGIREDMRLVGTWILLLLQADMSYPVPAFIPRTVTMPAVKTLVEHGLVEPMTHHRYRIVGLESEREKRSQVASQSASLRWNRPKVEGGKPATRRTRFKVLERDGYRCRYCGRTSEVIAIDVDHVIPVREGGSDDLDNLVAACVDCNSGKSGHELRAQPPEHARASAEPSARNARQAEPSQDKPKAEDAREDIVDTYYRLTGRFPSDTVREWVDRLANEFGYDATSRELGRLYMADQNLRTLLGRVENELKAGRHIATKRQAEAEKARLEAEARAKDISPAKAADNQRALKALMADWFSKDAA